MPGFHQTLQGWLEEVPEGADLREVALCFDDAPDALAVQHGVEVTRGERMQCEFSLIRYD